MIMKYKQGIHFILSCWFDQKAGITFISIFLFLIRIKSGYAQIRGAKIGTLMSKIACINPCIYIYKTKTKTKQKKKKEKSDLNISKYYKHFIYW